MQFFANLSIKSKLMAIIMLTVGVALMLAFAALVAFDRVSSQRAMVRKLEILAKVIGNNSVAALDFYDQSAARETLMALSAESHIVSACIYNKEGDVFARYYHSEADSSAFPREEAGYHFEDDHLIMFQPIVYSGVQKGMICLQSNLVELEERLQRYAGIAAACLMGSVLVALLVAGVLQRAISRPILALAQAAQIVSNEENYSVRVKPTSEDELGKLIVGFNEMLMRVEDRDNALRESEGRFRTLVEHASDAFFAIGRDGRIIDVNQAACDSLGLTRAELLALSVPDFVQDFTYEKIAQLWELLIPGEPITLEGIHHRKDGTIFPVETRLGPVEAGGRQFLLALARDISERRQLEAARRAAEQELEAQRALSMRSDRLRSLGEMAAGMAHELNQPLVGVRGLAEHILIGMERGWELGEEKMRDRIGRIVEQADRMVHIIEHVRMFAREAGKQESSSVQVNEVVRLSIDMLEAQFRSHGLVLECDLAEDLPLVQANPYSLEEVVLNLLNNARDAMEERLERESETGAALIAIRTAKSGGPTVQQVNIEVADTGTGIPHEIIDKVFDPFFTTKDPDKGTGLGLAISRSIIEECGGSLHIRSAEGNGTTAVISLPAAVDGVSKGSEDATY